MKSGKVLLLTILSALTLWACTPPLIYKSYWQKTPVTIDGQTKDWDVPLRFFDPKTKLNYSVSNDGENLYICIRATDDDNVSGITKHGLQIWIDTTGKKGHQIGLLCPVIVKTEHTGSDKGEKHSSEANQSTDQQGQLYTGTPNTARMNRMHQHFLDNAKQMKVTGFKGIQDGLLSLPNTYGINLGLSWNNANVLVYEAAIPFKSFLKYPLSPGDSTRIIGISFSYSVTEKRINPGAGGGGMSRGMGGAGGMASGGGMGGGGGRHGEGGGSSSSSVDEQRSIWTPFHLSTR